MSDSHVPTLRERNRQNAREMVLDAAERLLRKGRSAEFSMRSLAVEAGVGFATPFNHFGSKNEIMRALSTRLITKMEVIFNRRAPAGDCIDRVFEMGSIAVSHLLERPSIFRAVIGALGVAGDEPSAVIAQSRSLWAIALGNFAGLIDDARPVAIVRLADQLAFNFRGCLSFWVAGEVRDEQLEWTVRASIATTLLGFAKASRRRILISELERLPITQTGPVTESH